MDLFARRGVRPHHELGVIDARVEVEKVVALQRPAELVAEVRDLLVPGPAGRLPARLYHPAPGQRVPLALYVHGGGWAFGSVACADRPIRRLARAARCAIVSLEYRLAPETRFPGAFEDCLAAARWLADAAPRLGGDPASLTVIGDSAGGNLVAAVALALRDDPDVSLARQILIYPMLAPARDSPFDSYREHADGPLMTRAELEWLWSLYLGDAPDAADAPHAADPRAVPLAADDLVGLPTTTIVAAELDPLRDEALMYARRLSDAGVAVAATTYPGAAHGFWWMDGAMSQADELTEQLAHVLS